AAFPQGGQVVQGPGPVHDADGRLVHGVVDVQEVGVDQRTLFAVPHHVLDLGQMTDGPLGPFQVVVGGVAARPGGGEYPGGGAVGQEADRGRVQTAGEVATDHGVPPSTDVHRS